MDIISTTRHWHNGISSNRNNHVIIAAEAFPERPRPFHNRNRHAASRYLQLSHCKNYVSNDDIPQVRHIGAARRQR
jgi:hypothetical protein